MDKRFFEIPIDLIDRDETQPRRRFDEEALDELARSIARCGIIQPLVVQRGEEDGRFALIAGERRWRAAATAGLDVVPCVVREEGRASVAEVALAENVQRSALTPIEEAMAYKRLMVGEGKTQKEVADAIGKSRSSVAHRLRLLELPEEVQVLVDAGELEAGHGKALLAAPESQRPKLARDAVRKQWSVRQTEKCAKEAGQQAGGEKERGGREATSNQSVSNEIKILERRVGEVVGLPTKISYQPSGCGELILSYSSLEEFGGLLDRLGVETA